MFSFTRLIPWLALVPTSVLANSLSITSLSYVSSMSLSTQGLFNESMTWMDRFYDPEAGYLYDVSASAALRHETRSSAYYAVGLLARNEGTDVTDALKIITNIVHGQFKDPKDYWYATYQKYPDEPIVGNTAYPANIYNSWDPNWRGFIGTAFIIALEEFGHLIPTSTTTLMLDSLYNNTVGDSYRNGGINGDNLYPAYSNPSIMRAFVSGWTGRRLKESNFTAAGELYAGEIIKLFNRANTLSEFNSGTYTGVSLYALSLWAKYMPADSVMGQNGARLIQETWKAVAQLWHPQLKNVAGPWDRSYGYDMNKYLSLLALHLWSIIGKDRSSMIDKPYLMSHNADFATAPLFAVLASYHSTLVPADVVSALKEFSGEHTFTSSTFSPPFDLYPRNISAWLAPKISIGAQTFNETVLGGPATSTNSFNPALIQWDTGNGLGWINYYPSSKHIIAEASAGTLNLTYPEGDSASTFTLLVSPFAAKKTISGLKDIQGLNVILSGSVNMTETLSYAGSDGGASTTINNFEFWNFTYAMPIGSTAVPNLVLQVKLT